VKIKDILIAVVVIGAAVLLAPRSETAARHGAGTNSVNTSRMPYPCESDHSAQCTWEQYRQIAEEDCAKYRARGEKCEIVTDGQRPRAVRIPSDSERANMRREIDEGARHLCDNLADAGYECPR
jgi:hypothetical protein